MRPGVALFLFLLAGPAPAGSDPFPKADPASVGLEPDALRQLADVVRGWVRDGKVVGAELHVIKNRRTVLHEGFGHRDREAGAAMEPGPAPSSAPPSDFWGGGSPLGRGALSWTVSPPWSPEVITTYVSLDGPVTTSRAWKPS